MFCNVRGGGGITIRYRFVLFPEVRFSKKRVLEVVFYFSFWYGNRSGKIIGERVRTFSRGKIQYALKKGYRSCVQLLIFVQI